MSFIIEPITETDVEEWARLYYAAFKTVLGYLFIAEPTDESYKKWGVENLKTIQRPDTYAFKSVDSKTGQIVGIASWEIFRKPPTEETLNSMLTEVSESVEVDSKRRQGLLKDVVLSRKEIMSQEPSILLRILMVRPEYQRRGIGTSLMQWGLEQIDG
jgi:GNAT superfamily N-acetyltransferase